MAAGKGTRMQSDLPKVLHQANQRPLIEYVLDTSLALDPQKVVLIIAEVSGFLVKAENASTTNNVIQNNIMVVKDNGDDAEWRKKIAMQQRRLLDASQN